MNKLSDEQIWKTLYLESQSIFGPLAVGQCAIELQWNHYKTQAQLMEGISKLERISIKRIDQSVSLQKMEGHAACILFDRFVAIVGKNLKIYILSRLLFNSILF